jgi:hypothetical protein
MKPRSNSDKSRGLARWGWIKSYLGPALKYAGITSDDFDKIVSGGDQHIKQIKDASEGSSIPNIGISINGNFYPITGGIPTGNGFVCVVFEYEPGVMEIDSTSSPASFIFSGSIIVTNNPSWIVASNSIFSDDRNVRASVNPDGTIESNGKVIIPIAYRQGSNVEVFITTSINFQTIGTLGIDAIMI